MVDRGRIFKIVEVRLTEESGTTGTIDHTQSPISALAETSNGTYQCHDYKALIREQHKPDQRAHKSDVIQEGNNRR